MKSEHQSLLKQFSKEFWYAPSDVLMRGIEAEVWSKENFKPPVLSIGCGDGKIDSFLFRGKGKLDVGIDTDSKKIDEANKVGVYKKVIVADAVKTPFRNKSFKTIVSNSTFEHIKEDRKAVGEVGRILTQKGCFMFTVPSDKFIRILKEFGLGGTKLKRFNSRLAHFHYRSIEQWKEILKRSGFNVVQIQSYFPRDTLHEWYKLFGITTFKPYRRELWSYLKDSPYGKLAPRWLISCYLNVSLGKHFREIFTDEGSLLFIRARKGK
jgi:SAM-dependent methyltransferase